MTTNALMSDKALIDDEALIDADVWLSNLQMRTEEPSGVYLAAMSGPAGQRDGWHSPDGVFLVWHRGATCTS
jgi:hypothetical protein